jgi:hypothetical protein
LTCRIRRAVPIQWLCRWSQQPLMPILHCVTGYCRPACSMQSFQGFIVTSFQDNILWWCCGTEIVS